MSFLLYVVPWILGLLLVVSWVPWRDVFERVWGNNPNKAKIYVEYGEQTVLCKGRKVKGNYNIQKYQFKCQGVKRIVLVRKSYPYRYLMGARMIRVVGDALSAAPLGALIDTNQTVINGEMLNEVIEANIGASLVNSIFGKVVSIMQILVILGVLVLGGYFVYNNMIRKTVPPAQQTNNGQTVQPQTPTPDNEKPIIIPRPVE